MVSSRSLVDEVFERKLMVPVFFLILDANFAPIKAAIAITTIEIIKVKLFGFEKYITAEITTPTMTGDKNT